MCASCTNAMRDEDDIRTTGVTYGCQQRFPNWQSAIAAYTKSYENGEVVAYPEPNSRWWTDPIRVRAPAAHAANNSTASEEELWAVLADEDAAARVQLEQRLSGLALD